MRSSSRGPAALATLAISGALAVALPGAAYAAPADITITEWMYNADASAGEFIEITNTSTAAIDLADYSFDDDSAEPGTVPLAELGTLEPGESAIITESDDATFRAEWGLGDDVKILAGNETNLGRADAINIFDGDDLVDSLTYDDEGAGTVAGPRTAGVSGVPSTEAALGADDASQWQLSAVGDAENSWASTPGDIGSPGTSRFTAPAADAPWADVYINEVTSDNDGPLGGDVIELYNAGDEDVTVNMWLQSDSGGLEDAEQIGTVWLADDLVSHYIPAGDYAYFSSKKGLSSGGDSVNIYLPDGTLVDTMTYGAGEAGTDEDNDFGAAAMARCADGTGEFTPVAETTFGSPNACDTALDNPADGNAQGVYINEVTSNNDGPLGGDVIELYNAGDEDVTINMWLQSDSGGLEDAEQITGVHLADDLLSVYIPAGDYAYFSSKKGLSSGGDSVNIYLPDGTLVDTMTYGAGEAGTDEGNDFGAAAMARCADGTGEFTPVAEATFGGPNACDTALENPNAGNDDLVVCEPEGPEGTGTLPASAVPAAAWPGSADAIIADTECAWMTESGPEGRDISGLVFDPSGDVLYAVKNKNWLFRLVKDGDLWVPDTANGWAGGKELLVAAGDGQAITAAATPIAEPDTEGMTMGADGALYITTERDNAANDIPLNSILRFDPAQAGDSLIATDQWDLTADFPELQPGDKDQANLGFEGVAFVPDSYLTKYGFVDESTGATYDPADYPLHGDGLFFGALENDGVLYAYALNSDGTAHRVATADTGMGHVMDAQYDAATERIWALCDNTCGVVSTLMKIDETGAIVPDVAYSKPAGVPNNNVEGFALAPASTCAAGSREAVWSDDGTYGGGPGSDTYGHSLYSGSIDCDLQLSPQGASQDLDDTGSDDTGSDDTGSDDTGADADDDAVADDSVADDELAVTGFSLAPYAWAAVLLLGLGTLSLVGVRRR